MDLTLTGVAVKERDEVFLTAIFDEYADEHPDHCLVLRYHSGAFKQLLLDHAVCAVAVPPDDRGLVCFVGPHGEVTFAGNGGLSVEAVDPSDRGPSAMVLLRDAVWIGDALYACGMARMVYERRALGSWRQIDGGVFVPRELREAAVGFHAMAGNPSRGLICVGQYGEIWSWRTGRWTQEDSPTNVPLTGICITAQDNAVVIGMSGVLLIGTDRHWRVVEHGATTSDFWGIAEFAGHVYVANYDGVFRLVGDNLEKIDMGTTVDGSVPSTAYLAANLDVIWSVGHKNLAYSHDGMVWNAVDLPA